MQDLVFVLPGIYLLRTRVNKEEALRHSSSAHPLLLHCEQRSLRQRKVTGLAYDSEHGKLWQDIRADLDWTRAKASKVADAAEWAFGRRTARVLGVVMLFTVVVALLLVFLDWYIAPTKPGDKKDLVLAMAQILAGTALLSGLYFTWRTLQVNREGQITERFTRAIDQLGQTDDKGNKLFEIRLGGIYALERIARESKQDYWPVMEILTAYVRQHARQNPATARSKNASVKKPEYSESKKQPADESKNASVKKLRRKQRDKQTVDELAMLAPDIQAIVAVIRRLTSYYKDNQHDGKYEVVDLHETDLHGVDLRRADLTDANLTGAILDEADLEEATLKGAELAEAHLKGTRLVRAKLEEAVLVKADLEGANLREAHLTETYLTEATLYRATLDKANLQNAHLWSANLRRTSFRKARLEGAFLYGANLDSAILEEAHFEGADLRETTGLRGIPTTTGFSGSLLRDAYGDKYTKLPPNLKPPAHWGVRADEQHEED
jgi:uncharacterized protein YjbI with pentapeptide repeats